MPIPLIVVAGPTASGKSGLAVALAEKIGGEIVSADSMQIYRKLSIGTAKPTKAEMGGIPHYLLDFADPARPFSAADYVTRAEEVVKEILSRDKLPLFCGGTGLYFDAFLRGGFAETPSDPALREELCRYAAENGKDALYLRLAAIDPVSAAGTHPNNVKRVVRALEICLLSGKKKSDLDRETSEYPPRYRATVIGLLWSRELLNGRIDRRVDEMIRAGLPEEAERLRKEGIFAHSATAAQAIGYKELFGYLDGEMTLGEATEALKIATRQYAKRQMTWFRARKDIIWIPMDDGTEPFNFEKIVLVTSMISYPYVATKSANNSSCSKLKSIS